ETDRAEFPDLHTDDPLALTYQRLHLGIHPDCRAQRFCPLRQDTQRERAAALLAFERNLMAARRRTGSFTERPDLLIAGPYQAFPAGLHDIFLRVEATIERDALLFEPVEVGDALIGVETDLFHIR